MLLRTILILLLFPVALYSQQVTFCESIDATGKAANISDKFKISRKGGYIKILVNSKKRINSNSVVFDVYALKEGKEIFENSIRMKTNPFDFWFYKELTFFKEGVFIIYVYDESDQLLGIGKVTLSFRD